MDLDDLAGGTRPGGGGFAMRRRIASAVALWALAGLGLTGCGTQWKRSEAPLQLHQWNNRSGVASTSSPAASKAPTAPVGPLAALMAKPAATSSAPTDRAPAGTTTASPGAAGATASASAIPANA